jgi:hypothetical protein
MAHIIVVGNEKGGSGKSTTSMHVATALVRMGHKVGALDLDLRQKSFGRYVENRRAFLKRQGLDLPTMQRLVGWGLMTWRTTGVCRRRWPGWSRTRRSSSSTVRAATHG